jgi:alkylhydroperoxidase family enzyme
MDSERPWIDVLRDGRETPDLLRVYEALKIQPQEVDNILNIHSLNPESLEGHYGFYRSLMYGRSPLSRPEREVLAVAVSVRNECHY